MTNLTPSSASLALSLALAERERRRRQSDDILPPTSVWTEAGGIYVNRDRRKAYTYHHEDERRFVEEDGPWRYGLAKGGEGGGKSVAGIKKDLERLRRGMTGIMVSPDFEHFKKSLWPEFSRWCPWGSVIPEQRYRGRPGWEPTRPFQLTFQTPEGRTATLYCGGIEDPTSWEGPNVHFAHVDEARRHKEPAALKVLDGRCRLVGPQGEAPQLWLTTTPAMHWLYDYFGPPREDHPFPSFRADAFVISLLTQDNEAAGNLSAGFTRQRAQSLTESEARVLLNAEWEDIDVTARFLPTMIWWDDCRADLSPLAGEPIVLGADAGVSDDTFALVGVSGWQGKIAVRYARVWEPPKGGKLDYDPIQQEIEEFCTRHTVLQLFYDQYQLHQMMTNMLTRGIVWTESFSQASDRLKADKALLDAIKARTVAHDGNTQLREHIDNADRKLEGTDPQMQRLRIVKRRQQLKIDLSVALSMAHYRAITDFMLNQQ